MNTEQTRLHRRVQLHAALADATRLRIVDLLAVGDRSASELGAALGVPSNLLAHHVRTLEAAGVLTRRTSEGDRRRTYLTLHAHDAWVQHETDGAGPLSASRVVFVCTANTARSHLAAAAWRRVSDVPATSAGTRPGDRIHPGAVAAAERHGLDLPDVAPRTVGSDELTNGLVVTVCDRAHEELGGADRVHWSIPDPVPIGSEESFDRACATLSRRVATLARRVTSGS